MGLFSKKLYFDYPLNMGNIRKNLEHIESTAWDTMDLSAVGQDDLFLSLWAGEVYVIQRGRRIGTLPHDEDFERIRAVAERGDYYECKHVWIDHADERKKIITVEIRLD